jgi:hypothetical protein
MEEPKSNRDKLDYLLTIGELDEEAIKHVKASLRLSSLLHLFSMSEETLFKSAIKEGVFGIADAVAVLSLKAWVMHSRSQHGGKLPSKWLEEMTQEHYEEFIMLRADQDEKAVTSMDKSTFTDEIEQPRSMGISSPRMSDYPTFSGKMDDWYEFKDQFEGTAQGQGMGLVVQEQKDTDILDSASFKKHSTFIYSVLKWNCAKGTAAVKIRKFSDSNDGYRAWIAMKQYYESHGSVEQYVSDCMTELSKLKLDYNTHSGYEKYVSDFETLCLRLDEAKDPLSDVQKKVRFLSGINDRDYNEIVTLCRHAKNMDFDETVREVRSEAKAKGKLKMNKINRQVNMSMSEVNNNAANNSNYKNNMLPPALWEKMNPEQRRTYMKGRNSGPRDYGMQYSKSETSAPKEPDESPSVNTYDQKEEPRPSGNIWRTAPKKPRSSSTLRTVRPSVNKGNVGEMNKKGKLPNGEHNKKIKNLATAKYNKNNKKKSGSSTSTKMLMAKGQSIEAEQVVPPLKEVGRDVCEDFMNQEDDEVDLVTWWTEKQEAYKDKENKTQNVANVATTSNTSQVHVIKVNEEDKTLIGQGFEELKAKRCDSKMAASKNNELTDSSTKRTITINIGDITVTIAGLPSTGEVNVGLNVSANETCGFKANKSVLAIGGNSTDESMTSTFGKGGKSSTSSVTTHTTTTNQATIIEDYAEKTASGTMRGKLVFEKNDHHGDDKNENVTESSLENCKNSLFQNALLSR